MLITGLDQTPLKVAQDRLRERVPQVINPRLLDAVAYYYRYAPTLDIRWTVALCQSIHETDYMRSAVVNQYNNYAGIKVQPGAPGPGGYRRYDHPAAGVKDHVNLMAVYAGVHVPGMVDPTRNDRLPGIIEAHIGRPYVVSLEEMNGIWAYPGTEYGQNIERLWKKLFA